MQYLYNEVAFSLHDRTRATINFKVIKRDGSEVEIWSNKVYLYKIAYSNSKFSSIFIVKTLKLSSS